MPTGVLGMVTVLMVEDEPIIRNLVSEELTDAGFDVVVVGNADEAVAVLEARNNIQLVFTDIDIPGSMDGLKLAAAVRDRWPPIHIIITSGKKRPAVMPSEAIFVPKPYLSDVVVDAMKTFENML
jgi:CheY-like chemotaxis protein